MILLDTHVLVWSLTEERKLSRVAHSTIRRARASSSVAISVITMVELASLMERGRLHIQGTIETVVAGFTEGVTLLPITREIAVLTAYFPPAFSRDPSDRIIAATARAEGIPLVTADLRMQGSPHVKTIW
ncbi:MAG TPA: type II toxin-antitoxin system VapC family toxin [Candidatus Eisenbacteria bacterium]|nr:type II toxin-antitoxin system VapC family toxin [Candidatus Eisenbacteria bacterium]